MAESQPTPTQPEEWRDVLGWEGHYQVSDHGNVRSLDRYIATSSGRERFHRGITRKPKTDTGGYKKIMLTARGRKNFVFVHRLVLETFVGPCPDGMECCHNDGVRTNNHVSNLRWDTRKSNRMDRIEHGNDTMLKRTECPRGHALEMPNLRASHVKRGARACLACDRAKAYARKYNMLDRFEEIADDRYRKIMLAD